MYLTGYITCFPKTILNQKHISRLALKIVVGAREQGTLNWEHRREFWAILLFFTYL
jgi:hypothetical protein